MRFFLISILMFSFSVLAHQTSITKGGKELVWKNKVVPLQIKNSTSDLTATEVKNIIKDSMNQWNSSSSSAKVIESVSSANEIKFVSNFPYGSAVVGITELSFNNAGAIQKAVISLNDDYTFRNQPGLAYPMNVFLGDVVSHELGHLFGLSHSEVLNSTMFYSSFSGHSTISFDDKSGLRQKYDSHFGQISGTVQGGKYIGVLGVHVQAISRATGETSGVFSDENGNFVLGGLDLEDTYYLYTSPLNNLDSLPMYYANTQNTFCPGAYTGSFFSACGEEGKPQGINLTSQSPAVDVGIVTINCGLKSDSEYSARKLESDFTPLTIFDYAREQKNEKSFVGWFRKSVSGDWSSADIFKVDLGLLNLGGNQKYLKVSLVSFPLGTQLQYNLSVKKNGVDYLGATRAMSYSSVTQTYNPDLEALIPLDSNAFENNFDIHIRSKNLDTTSLTQIFPIIKDFTSGTYLPYLLVTSVWEDTDSGMRPILDTEVNLSDNYACMDAQHTFAVTKTQSASDDKSVSTEASASAACGTIDPPNSGPGSSLPLMVLGFVLALIPTILSNSRKKFLS